MIIYGYITNEPVIPQSSMQTQLLIGLISLVFVLLSPLCSAEADAPIKIMPLGDSITQGVGNDYAPASGHDSYRRFLYQQLVGAGYEVDFVGSMSNTFNCGKPAHSDFDADHEGHWAWRADEIINGKKNGCRGSGNLSHWLTANTPDIALIHIGTNDAFQNQPVESTLNELQRIIDIFRQANPTILIFLAKLLPVHEPQNPARGERVAQLNERIHTVVAEKDQPDSRVILVDHTLGFQPETDSFDGVHPNLRGEEKMAVRWFQALVPYLPEP